MKILTISGSSREDSSNIRLLESLPGLFPNRQFHRYKRLDQLPLFRADDDHHPWSSEVLNWRKAVSENDALLVCTPEYLHNLPSLIKNALEWLSTSGELLQKPVLAMTFTPHEPRGEKALQSLIWTLQALDARVVGQLALYQTEVKFEGNLPIFEEGILDLLKESIYMLG